MMHALNRWKENTESAREHAEAAKQLCVEKKYFTNLIPSLDARLQRLEPDVIDEILKEYEDHVQWLIYLSTHFPLVLCK